ncbi:hypothetical protein T265_08084 [Opisthorchis viverrini]|uniref:Uncharacterized protein n=1 Tax=Opisthorchis viverrini TaxID=6198 RepID=A0A074ZAA7_OPIVI|nr:hypothetical protein T265_08084 [Opisthorchis viverrini]KER24191.1 hypothetical protein T265_08084 [Opisthorchis viverrini]
MLSKAQCALAQSRLAHQAQSDRHTGSGVRLNGKNVPSTPCATHKSVISTQGAHNGKQTQVGARWTKWLDRESTDRTVRGSNPTSASRLPLSRLGRPGNIPALVPPSCGTHLGAERVLQLNDC